MQLFPLSLLSRYCFFLAITAITVLAVWPTKDLVVSTGWDKSNHLLAFFVLLLLADYGWEQKSSLWIKVLGLLVYGLLLELLQAMVPPREFSLADIFSDGLGMALYLLLRSPLLAFRRVLEKLPFIKVEQGSQ